MYSHPQTQSSMTLQKKQTDVDDYDTDGPTTGNQDLEATPHLDDIGFPGSHESQVMADYEGDVQDRLFTHYDDNELAASGTYHSEYEHSKADTSKDIYKQHNLGKLRKYFNVDSLD